MKKTYNKLVRDFIPQIIVESGKQPVTRIATDDEIQVFLAQKLMEEVQEYIKSREAGELADILEVLQSIAKEKGINWEEIEHLTDMKKVERGGFEGRVVLEEVIF